MIRSITLQNFKSFGERQTIPLEPITVLVGPNNSGKSSFMSVGRFVANMVIGGLNEALQQEGGSNFVFHRPRQPTGELHLEWNAERGDYSLLFTPTGNSVHIIGERLRTAENDGFIRGSDGSYHDLNNRQLGNVQHSELVRRRVRGANAVVNPLMHSRVIKLSLSELRADSAVVPTPQLTQVGAGLAAVLGLWRGSQPEKCEELEAFLRKCLPEVHNALVRPAPVPGYQRLWIRQTDGEEFDADHLSDGVLSFTALTMHAIDAGPGQMIFIEEPEHSIHPRRLRELVDLLKEIASAKGCQFVIATHSPVLLNAFRDEPEAILLFRRSETGTKVKRLEDVPELRAALQSSPPGDMLEHGFFNQAF